MCRMSLDSNLIQTVSKHSRNIHLKHLDISECKGKLNFDDIGSNFPNLERLSIRFLSMSLLYCKFMLY